jgi:SET domain-containing protein
VSADAVIEFLRQHLPFESMQSSFCLETYSSDNTAGMGLRTRERIPKNAYVIEYGGESISFKEGESREKLYAASNAGCYIYFCQYERTKVWYVQ